MSSFPKLPAIVGLVKWLSGEWKIGMLVKYVKTDGLVSAPNRKMIDELVTKGYIEFEEPEKGVVRYDFGDNHREVLIKNEIISSRVSAPRTSKKKELMTDQQKNLSDLFDAGKKLFRDFIANNPTLQEISKMEFEDDKGTFKVIPSYYMKNTDRAIGPIEGDESSEE